MCAGADLAGSDAEGERKRIEALGRELGMAIPDACTAGVIQNIELLERHWRDLGAALARDAQP